MGPTLERAMRCHFSSGDSELLGDSDSLGGTPMQGEEGDAHVVEAVEIGVGGQAIVEDELFGECPGAGASSHVLSLARFWRISRNCRSAIIPFSTSFPQPIRMPERHFRAPAEPIRGRCKGARWRE